MRSRLRLNASLIALLIAAAGLASTPARTEARLSAPAVRTVVSPSEPGLTLGLSGADSTLTQGGPAETSAWTARAHAVGAAIIRLGVSWAQVAPVDRPSGFDPANPDSAGYRWAQVDAQVRQVASEGFRILLEVQDAPTWAEGTDRPASAGAGTWEPDATQFGQFATALAARYSGTFADPLHPGATLPAVRYWQAWNEPNLSEFLTPQWIGTGAAAVPESPVVYRRLENAFYASIKAVSPDNTVVAAGTAPYGDPPGGNRMAPVTFDQNLLCLSAANQPTGACPAPTRMDAIDDHPYVSGLCCLGPTWHAGLAADTSIPDVYKIVNALHAAEAAGTVGPGRPQVWASEIGWNTDPPNPDHNQASPAAQVGLWATQALYILWSQGVSTVLWYQLQDDAPGPNGYDGSVYTEGLYYRSGAAKPAAAAFAFPFLTVRQTRARVRVWGRAPRSGVLAVQRRLGRRWVTVLRLRVRSGQVFEAPLALRGPASLRAVVAGAVSSPWAASA